MLTDVDGNVVVQTKEHKPNHPMEKQRIENAGEFVSYWGTYRVSGVLALSRAFGDFQLKSGLREDNAVSAVPDVNFIKVRLLQPTSENKLIYLYSGTTVIMLL